VLDLHHVTGRVDRGIARLQGRTHGEPTSCTDLEARLFRESEGRAHPDGEEHEIGVHRRAVAETNLIVLDRSEGSTEVEADPVVLEFLREKAGKLTLKVGHDLGRHLHETDVEAALGEGFHHLQPDESTPDDHRRPWFLLIQVSIDSVHVIQRPELEDVVFLDTGEGRDYRLAPLRKDQRVVGKGLCSPSRGVAGVHHLRLPIDPQRLGICFHVDAILVVKRLGDSRE
jgi:hypothetical protein